ncbi:MAG: FecR family protein [Flavobacteriales bacterium]|nr:FecR family protein [Flavobacteriales bacterium]
MEQSFLIASLLSKKIKGEISFDEEKKLQQWIEKSESNAVFYEKMLDDHTLLNKLEDYQLFDRVKTWSSLEKKLFKTKVIRLEARRLLRYAAILIPFIMLAGLSYYWEDFSSSSLANVDEIIKPYEHKATLILASGEILDLQNKTITNFQEGRALLLNHNNSLKYTSEEIIKEIDPLIYNTLVTPKGGNYKLTLSDGTEIWLNANSSIKYPVVFTDSTREVFLEGEAFFNVQHNGKPFLVNTQETNIRVLGTSFNVWAYSDESHTATTLVEGSIKLSTAKMEKVLVPNEQARILLTETDIRVKEVNTDLYTSWMEGKIEFEAENLEAVMRRLARLYNFKYSFENEAAKDFHFTARIDNSQPISSILKMLELTTNVEFRLKENTIIIL